MNKLITRIAIASALVLQILGASTASVAAPILDTSFSGSYSAGPSGVRTLPANLLSAQGYALHPLTNDQINNSLSAIAPEIFIVGIDVDKFAVPTLPGSPCSAGCFMSIDIEALQAYLAPTVRIEGIAVSMFQIGSLNEGQVTLRQGTDQEDASLPFSTEDQYTLRYFAGILEDPLDLSGLSLDIGFFVGRDPSARGLWAQAYYITRAEVRSVPEPGTAGLAFLGAAGFGFVRLLTGAGGTRRVRRECNDSRRADRRQAPIRSTGARQQSRDHY